MRKHWFFDFDGTLCDTEADIKAAWRATLRDMGRDCPRFDAVYRTGPTIDQVVRMLFDDATPELVEEVRRRFGPNYDCSGLPNTRPYPWIPAWLDRLASSGCRVYIATNKRFKPLGSILRVLGWEARFDGVYAFDMYPGERLPKAELLKRAMRERGISPDDAVMAGDTAGDIEAGRAAGMRTVACTWGYGTREELEGADETVDAR